MHQIPKEDDCDKKNKLNKWKEMLITNKPPTFCSMRQGLQISSKDRDWNWKHCAWEETNSGEIEDESNNRQNGHRKLGRIGEKCVKCKKGETWLKQN